MSSFDRPAQGRAGGRPDASVTVPPQPGETSEPEETGETGETGEPEETGEPDRPPASTGAPGGPIGSGTVLAGRYRIAERVGAGGMATIYRGFDEVLERPVAVKVLHAHLVGDPELQARFRTEARHAASLSHPHIVAVFDQGVAELPYIVMELVDGPSLREVLDDRGALAAPEALAVVEPVARALARAHRAGVVHRDIKPENVLVAGDGTPKVADFGIARVVAGTSHTQTGALIGSVHYIAPELVDGGEANPASDQYALGVVLYELLTGRRPFAGDTPMAVALRHTRDRVPAPSTQGAACGPEVDAVVTRATDHDPPRRYPDLDTFADALHDAVPGGATEVEVRAGSDGETLVIPAEVREVPPAVVPTGRTGPQVTGPSAPRRELPRHPDAPARRRGRRARRVLLVAVLTLVLLGAGGGGAFAWWHYVVAPITPVPEVTGHAEDEAFDLTHELGLGLTVDGFRYDFDAPEGEVLEQHPPPGTDVRRGDDVTVVLSQGPEPVEMPRVVGLPEADALEVLRDERLEVTVTRRHDDEVPDGEVLSQDPPPGTGLRQGDAVEIVRSLGIEQVEVPALAGRDLEEVENLVATADLELGEVARTWSDEHPTAGEVIIQSLEQGSMVDKGSVVEVTVSLGPLTIEVPDVRGESVGEARDALQARALEVDIVEQSRPRFGPIVRGSVGLVEEQLPSPGEPIERGETVTLYTFGD